MSISHKSNILTEQSYEQSEDDFEHEARKLGIKYSQLTKKHCQLSFFGNFKQKASLEYSICKAKYAKKYYSELLTLVKKYEKHCKTKQCKARYTIDEEQIQSTIRRINAWLDVAEARAKTLKVKK